MDLVERFEAERDRLRGVAYRMLGSFAEAEDAVQETWLRLHRTDPGGVDNLAAWLTTVVSRICLDMLRSRKSRREEPLPDEVWAEDDPEQAAVLLDSVGRALLVVLDTLSPAERIAFVLHDLFGLPFERIAPIVDRSPVAAKKLASRARLRVQGSPAVSGAEFGRQRRVVEAFLVAARGGDLTELLTVLAPDVIRTADRAALPPHAPLEIRGADRVARGTLVFGRKARFAALALVDGRIGAVVAPRGRLRLVLTFTVVGDRIAGYEVIGDPARLRALALSTVPG